MGEKIGEGVELSDSEGLEIVPASLAAVRRSRAAPNAAPDLLLDDALWDADFDTIADTTIRPRATRRSGTTAAKLPTVEVSVAPGMDAVLLVESTGNVFTWIYPDDREPAAEGRRAVANETLRFSLAAAPPFATPGEQRRRSPMNWIGDRLIDPIRIRVLRFVARGAVELAVKEIEKGLVAGLVDMAGASQTWIAGGKLPTLRKGSSPARVLLMVHGTFSTTAGSFAALEASDEGRTFLSAARRHYHAIIGFDHKTLAEGPDTNAQAILDALRFLPGGTIIDAVAYSRGGLVYRALAERLAPELRSDLRFERAIFVGCTNGGTNLAEPANWHALVDLYTNTLMAGARMIALLGGAALSPFLSFAMKTIGGFVQVLPRAAIDENRVPGLAAMQPAGKFVKDLNAAAMGKDFAGRYCVVASDFEPRIDLEKGLTGELARFLIDRVADRLFTVDNDLVVHTASMADFGKHAGGYDNRRTLSLPTRDAVYHTIYFAEAKVAAALNGWLLGDEADFAAAFHPAISGDKRYISAFKEKEIGQEQLRIRPRPERRTRSAAAGGAHPGDSASDPRLPTDARAGPHEPSAAVERAGPPDSASRYHFAAEMERMPDVARPTSLFVTISREELVVQASNAARSTPAAVAVEPDRMIEVQIIPLSNCTIEGENACEVPVPEARPTSLRFLVLANAPGSARVQVEARQGQRLLASFILEPLFVEGDATRLFASQVATRAHTVPKQSAVLRIYEMRQPDGTLLLRYDLSSADPNIAMVEEVRLPAAFDMKSFVSEFLSKLDAAYGLSKTKYKGFLQRISEFSASETAVLIPDPIRAALWKCRSKVESVQVISDSPHIPWELLYIEDPADPGGTNAGFLCEWGLIRWMYNAPWPGDELLVRSDRVRFVIPDYLDSGNKLREAERESGMLAERFAGAKSVPANGHDVRQFLREEAAECDVLHFACHGESRNQAILDSGLILAGERDENGELVEDVLEYQAVQRHARFAPEGPSGLVFLNACQTGRLGEGIVGLAGFADAFLRPASKRGAAAFVGALWSIDDHLALNFATAFYDALRNGKSLVHATTAARLRCQEAGDFTWLAYSVYGNANAVGRASPPPAQRSGSEENRTHGSLVPAE